MTGPSAGMCSIPLTVKRGVGERLGPHEGPDQVVGLQAHHIGHTRRPVPVLERPPAGEGHRHQPGVGVQRMRVPDSAQHRYVEDTVGVHVAVGEVDSVRPRPVADLVPLAHPPGELADQAAGIAAVDLLIAGGHDVVEVDGLGKRCHQVERGGGGQHDQASLGPVGAERLQCPRLDQVDQRLDRGHAGAPHGVGRTALHQPGRGPGERHERHRLAE